MANLTLANLISYVAQAFGQTYATGTADSGSTSTLVDDALIASGYSLIGHQILLAAGGAPRRIIAFDDTTGTVTFAPSYSTVGSGTAYEILPVPKGEIISAIQKAMRSAGNDFLTVRYTTLTLSTGQQDYDLAQDAVIVVAAWRSSLPEGSSINTWMPFTAFEIIVNEGRRRIVLREGTIFDPNPGYSHTLRYSYYAYPERLSAAGDVLQAGEGSGAFPSDDQPFTSFIEEYALHLLHEKALQLNPSGEKARMHNSMSRSHLEKAEMIRKRNTTAPRTTRRVRRPRIAMQVMQ